jgi:4a-hydroxytetrahydrobiopterin dehydratase
MTKLVNESCTACNRDAVPVSAAETAELLPQLPGWTVVERDGARQLEKTYRFRDFCAALDFANAVGELAEGANHHPTLEISWGQTRIHWWTHTLNGLHRNDFVMAAKTDYLYRN